MNQKYVPVLVGVSMLVVGLLGSNLLSADAAQTPKVYELYDANNTYLGDVVGINYGEVSLLGRAISYTTYLPSLKGLLQVNSLANDGALEFSMPETVQYDGENCTGNAYINFGGEPWFNPWILVIDGSAYSIATSAIVLASQSQYVPNTQGCVAPNATPSLLKLTPITLPFNPDSVVPPFELR